MEPKTGRCTGLGPRTGFAVLLALALSSIAFAASASAQDSGDRPIIAGDPVVGETLTSSSAGLLGEYRWERCDPATTTCGDDPVGDPDWVVIPGADAQTYTIPPADLGYLLRVNTGPAGLWTASAPIGPVTNPPPPPPPEASTGVASGITDTAAILNGIVDPNGTSTSYYFEYGKTTTYDSRVPVPDGDAGSGDSDQDVSAAISGLSPSTEYHFRLVAESTAGTATGADKTFTTTPTPPAPEAITGEAGSITPTGATLNGIVDPNGAATSYRFEYGATAAYGSQVPVPDASAGDGFNDQAVSAAISDLSPSTVYHYRLVANSAGGESTGSDNTFTTADPPPPTLQHGISFLGETTAGTVTVKPRGQSEFVPLTGRELLGVGAVVDARNGTIRVTAATGPYGSTTPDQSMDFYKGMFKLKQSRKTDSRAIAKLTGPRICGPFVHRNARTATGSGPQAVAARRRGRRLWGRGRGGYATAGRGGTGSVVGTTYLTEEKCNGTYFKVSKEPGAHGGCREEAARDGQARCGAIVVEAQRLGGREGHRSAAGTAS